jgi:hypothetical protein
MSSRSLPLAAAPKRKHPDAEIFVGFDFTRHFLRADELLTGTPAIAAVNLEDAGDTTLDFDDIAVNAAEFVNDTGETVAVGKGVVCSCTGGTAGEDYEVTCTVETDGDPPQTIPGVVTIEVRER